MKHFLQKVIVYFSYIRFIGHIILYEASRNKEIINADISRYMFYYDLPYKSVYALVYLLMKDRYYRGVFYMRVGFYSHFISWIAPKDNTFTIGPNSINVGEGIYARHAYATILNAKSIGRNFSCRQCTTIGNKKDGESDMIPIIGDNVQLGANVCIIGNIRIGDNVIIGAGSIVVKDVPNNCVVAGNPARVIKYIEE